MGLVFLGFAILVLLLFRMRDEMVVLSGLFYGLLFLDDSTMYIQCKGTQERQRTIHTSFISLS
jgi:hypothetical protein